MGNDLLIKNGCKNPLTNGFIASVPRNPWILKTIENICNNIENRYYGNDPLSISGPTVFGNTLRNIVGGSGPFLQGLYTFENIKYEILEFEKEFISQNNEYIIEIKPKKDEFNSDISSGNVYWKMWKNKDVYK
jgi:hypothetical protein